VRLYGYHRSTASFRVRIALNLKGIAYDGESLAIREGAHRMPPFRTLNPQGLIPALDDGGTLLSQSLAIIEYLEELYPQPALLPRSPVDRARVRSMALAVACDMHPLNNLRVLEFLRGPLGIEPEKVETVWYAHWIAQGFAGLEEEARRWSADGHHMFGAAVTLADVCIVPQMYNAVKFRCDLAPYPTLRGICAHLEQMPAFAAASPEAHAPEAGPA
jgi:maleylacetoacetate isomerase